MITPVLILGGGIAGLAAGRELTRRGVAVTIIEAKDRLGGRIHTVREGALPIELGAEFVHGRNRSLLKAIRQAGLSMHDASDRHQLFQDGQLKPVKLWERIDKIISRVNLRQRDQSFQEFVDGQSLKPTDRRQTLDFVEGFDAADARCISAHALLKAQRATERMEGDQQSRVNEGYSALVDFLAQEFETHGGVLLNRAEVRGIRWKPRQVEVHLRHRRQLETLTGAAAILTFSLGVLKAGTVTINPTLTAKSQAIREFAFGNVMKLILVFRDRWWGSTGPGFFHAMNEPIPTWWGDPRGPILTGWAGGPHADALLNHTPAKLETMGLEILGRIFSERASALRKRLRATHTWNWAEDTHVRGAYSYIPVNGMDLPGALAAPVENTLFFAGEATVADAQMGTVFGALKSGLRAARELLKA